MSRTAISKLWSFFALASLTLSFLFFLRTTGMEPHSDEFGVLGYKATTIPLLALPMDMVLMAVTLWLTRVWSTQIGGPSWAHRLPIFHFESKDVDPATLGGRIYQSFGVGLALILPLVLTLQMAGRFVDATIYAPTRTDKPVVVKAWAQFDFSTLTSTAPHMLRFGEPNGPEFFAWEPWLFGFFLLLLMAFWCVTMISIFREAPSQS